MTDWILSFSRGLLGLATLLAVAYTFSTNRKAIDWKLVFNGIVLQIVIGALVLKVPFIEFLFAKMSSVFVTVINFSQAGTAFLFRSFTTQQIEPGLLNFAFNILPTIVFFSALSAALYYLGVLQRVVFAMAWIMKRTMRLSGAESLSAAGNIFLGQTEAPLLVRPYIERMTQSELLCLMTGGMATIAGGVLSAYIAYLGGDDPAQQALFAKHLLTASVMSAPAAIVASKMLMPETDRIDETLNIPTDRVGSNLLEAISLGTTDGLKLAVNVGAMLLVFTALIALVNYAFGDIIGRYTGLNSIIASHTSYDSLSMQFLLGYVCAPFAWLMGVPTADVVLVGQLLGEKTVLNEFYAYSTLGQLKFSGAITSEKSIVMATYMLCGFSNFASIGIQIGGIGALAPSKRSQLSQLGLRALLGGSLACLFTAVVVGFFYT